MVRNDFPQLRRQGRDVRVVLERPPVIAGSHHRADALSQLLVDVGLVAHELGHALQTWIVNRTSSRLPN